MKKLIAGLIVLTLLMVPMTTALANDGAGDGIVVEFNDTEHIVFTVPTSVNFDFVLDPQGIFGMTDEAIEALVADPDGTDRLGTVTDDTWAALPTAEQVVFPSAAAPVVINDSNRDLAVTIAFSFTSNDKKADSDRTVTAIAGIDPKVNNHTCPNDATCTDGADSAPCGLNIYPADVFIGATFSTANVQSEEPANFAGSLTLPIRSGDNAKTALFVFPEAKYEDETISDNGGALGGSVIVNRKETYVGPGNGTQFVLSGKCNPNADWTILRETKVGDVGQEDNVEISIAIVWNRSVASADDLNTTTTPPISVGSDPAVEPFGLRSRASGTAIGGDFVSIATTKTFTYTPPTTPAEEDAIAATADADAAATDAVTALGLLSAAIAAFEDDQDDDYADEDVLQAAIDDAEIALGLAETALGLAETALTAAEEEDDPAVGASIITALENAITALGEAIADLATEIASAEGLMGPSEVGFFGPGATSLTVGTASGATDTVIDIPFYFGAFDIVYVGLDVGSGLFDVSDSFSASGNNLVFDGTVVAGGWEPSVYQFSMWLDDDPTPANRTEFKLTITITA